MMSMLKFFKKYELQCKVLATIVWFFGAIDRFIISDDPEKRNWNLFVGIVFFVLGIFYLVDVIQLTRKGKV